MGVMLQGAAQSPQAECDACHRTIYGVTHETSDQLRAALSRLGWVLGYYNGHGVDICPNCTESGRRKLHT